MFGMSFWHFMILFVVVYLAVYALFDRILSCIEQCSANRTYRQIQASKIYFNNAMPDADEFCKKIEQFPSFIFDDEEKEENT